MRMANEWSTVVRKGKKMEGLDVSEKNVFVIEQKKKTVIVPAFSGLVKETSVIDRVTVKLTHFNKREFNGYVTREDAKHQIFQALGLDLSLHHGTFFRREDADGQLFITFKLAKVINKEELQYREFWYLKTSKAGKDDTISGEVVYPAMEVLNKVEFQEKEKTQESNIKQLRIDGCGYVLTENQIRHWIGLFANIEGELVEEAEEDNEDGICSGTGVYLVSVKIERRIPNLVPMFGQKVTLSHHGVSRICKKCFKYHKREISCVKGNWHEFVDKFKSDHPRIPDFMFEEDEDYQDSWLCETEKKNEDDNIETESEPEQETSDEEESDKESKYSDMELSLSDTDEFARLLAIGQLKEKEITMLFELRKREKNEKKKKKMNK